MTTMHDPSSARRILAERVFKRAKREAKDAVIHRDDPKIERIVRRLSCNEMAYAVSVYHDAMK